MIKSHIAGGIKLVLLAIFISSFFSCSSSKHSKLSQSNIQNQTVLFQAKQSDVPLPVGYVIDAGKQSCLEKSLDAPQHYLFYGSMKVGELIAFYRQNMERLGWDIYDLSEKEGFVFCRKPGKICGLSIRSCDNKRFKGASSTIGIFIFEKNDLSVSGEDSKEFLFA